MTELTELTISNHPLRLATGSHKAGSGKGCAMNLISWENGDTKITDLPECSDPMLARIVQRVNDTICAHRDGDFLCPECSMVVLDLAHRTVGTSAHRLSEVDLQRVWVRVAVDQARAVQHLNTDPRVEAAIVAAERWAEEPSAKRAKKCREAAAAADAAAAAYAAYAAYAAAAVADAAAAADAAAYAAYTAAAYADAGRTSSRLIFAHRAIGKFIELTGIRSAAIPTEAAIRLAAEKMLAGAS